MLQTNIILHQVIHNYIYNNLIQLHFITHVIRNRNFNMVVLINTGETLNNYYP